jgi:uncharacterized membrane protein YfcA
VVLTVLYTRITAMKKEAPPQNLKGYLSLTGDLELSGSNLYIYPTITFFSGIMAGLLGIGGGVINAPVLLHLGVNPLVVAATTSTMIILTSSTSLVSYVFFQQWIVLDGVIFFILGFIGTYVGQVLSYIMLKGGKTYLISFVMGGVVIMSVTGMTIETIVTLAKGEEGGDGGFC